MKDTHFIITGAGSGIGQALAILAASKGAKVIATDINEKGLEETKEKGVAQNGLIHTHRLDVSDSQAIIAFKDMVMKTYSPQKITLVNNAGVALYSGTFAETQMEDFDWLININLYGVIRMTKAFLPIMLAQNQGNIVNVSSIFGITAMQMNVPYSASKFAVRGFTESLRQELDLSNCGVSASCVHPGGIKTNIARAARFTDSGSRMLGRNNDLTRQAFNDNMLRTSPDKAADVILRGVERNRRRIVIGMDAHLMDWVQRLMPALYQRLIVMLTRWSR